MQIHIQIPKMNRMGLELRFLVFYSKLTFTWLCLYNSVNLAHLAVRLLKLRDLNTPDLKLSFVQQPENDHRQYSKENGT